MISTKHWCVSKNIIKKMSIISYLSSAPPPALSFPKTKSFNQWHYYTRGWGTKFRFCTIAWNWLETSKFAASSYTKLCIRKEFLAYIFEYIRAVEKLFTVCEYVSVKIFWRYIKLWVWGLRCYQMIAMICITADNWTLFSISDNFWHF